MSVSHFPGRTVSEVMNWFCRMRLLLGSPRGLPMEPREVQSSLPVEHTPELLSKAVDVGKCLDRLAEAQREAVLWAHSRSREEREPRFASPRFRRLYFGGLSRLGRIMRAAGVIE